MSIQYRYDELNRLVAAVYDNGQEVAYAYDAAGNRISAMVEGDTAPAPSLQPPTRSDAMKPPPPENLGRSKRPGNTSPKPPPPEKL